MMLSILVYRQIRLWKLLQPVLLFSQFIAKVITLQTLHIVALNSMQPSKHLNKHTAHLEMYLM